MTDQLHAMAEALYAGPYLELFARLRRPGWERIERHALADGARARIEVLWLNPAAAAGIASPQFFGAAA